MKAAVNETYGPPSVIKIKGVKKPTPGPNDILVEVHYSSVNRTDVGFLRAKPFVTRFFTGIIKPKYLTLGCEYSGIVKDLGKDVKKFKLGDRVFGFDDSNFGGYAEYKIVNENQMVETIPSNTTQEQAAVALEGAHYALFYIYKVPESKKTRVFVNGATGAIGSAGVQILKALGYYVEASSTTKDIGKVKKLGADKVIDWEKQDIKRVASNCDVYFDAVGKSSFKQAKKILNPHGIYMSSELGPYGQNPLLALFNVVQRLFTKRNVYFPIPKTRLKEATIIKQYLANGTFIPLVDRTYSLVDIQKAFEYVESGKKVGNVVIKVKK